MRCALDPTSVARNALRSSPAKAAATRPHRGPARPRRDGGANRREGDGIRLIRVPVRRIIFWPSPATRAFHVHRPASLLLTTLALLLAACARDIPPGERDVSGAGPGFPPPSQADPVLGPEACRDSGYLCPGLAERDEARILRWHEGTEEIRIRIPPPPIEPAGRARALQDAVARGILAWQDKPFTLRIERSARPAGEDFAVEWADRIGASELGRAQTEWTRTTSGEAAMRVPRFVLAYLNPFDPSSLLSPEQIQLTAAHEMGHALGLPHSDSPRDVMYPTNTATSLTPRDFETMWGLYALPNGAVLGEAAPAGGL